jgi:hypothetical protein
MASHPFLAVADPANGVNQSNAMRNRNDPKGSSSLIMRA